MIPALWFLLGLVLGSPATGPGEGSHLTIPLFQSVLGNEAARFATAWTARDTRALARAMSSHGIRLHLPDEDHLHLRPRQAEAALRVFLGRYEAGETAVTRVSPSGGESDRGFAEIRWQTGSPRVSEPVIFTVFVGFALQDGGWSVTEIRVLF